MKKKNKELKIYLLITMIVISIIGFSFPVFAADDPLNAIDNMSDLMFRLIHSIGYIMLGWGVVQVGISIKGQDPSQRINGVMFFAGGLIIANAKVILDFITK